MLHATRSMRSSASNGVGSYHATRRSGSTPHLINMHFLSGNAALAAGEPTSRVCSVSRSVLPSSAASGSLDSAAGVLGLPAVEGLRKACI